MFLVSIQLPLLLSIPMFFMFTESFPLIWDDKGMDRTVVFLYLPDGGLRIPILGLVGPVLYGGIYYDWVETVM